MNHRVLVFTDEIMLRHDPGPGHPERPARLEAIMDELARPSCTSFERAASHAAKRAHIESAHDSTYIAQIDALRGCDAQLDADTAVSPGSVDSAYLAAGAAIDAVGAVVHQAGTRAFALVRPPG